jgi:hypothetical protein
MSGTRCRRRSSAGSWIPSALGVASSDRPRRARLTECRKVLLDCAPSDRACEQRVITGCSTENTSLPPGRRQLRIRESAGASSASQMEGHPRDDGVEGANRKRVGFDGPVKNTPCSPVELLFGAGDHSPRCITVQRTSGTRAATARVRRSPHLSPSSGQPSSNGNGAPGPLCRIARSHSLTLSRRGPNTVGSAASASIRRVGRSAPKSSG